MKRVSVTSKLWKCVKCISEKNNWCLKLARAHSVLETNQLGRSQSHLSMACGSLRLIFREIQPNVKQLGGLFYLYIAYVVTRCPLGPKICDISHQTFLKFIYNKDGIHWRLQRLPPRPNRFIAFENSMRSSQL